MDPDNSFARLVKLRRTALGLSQSALADLVGRSASAIRSWERGASTPSDGAVVQSLAAVLGVEEKALRASVGLPYEQPVEDLDPIGEGALDLFVDEDADGDEADETEAGGTTAGNWAAAASELPVGLTVADGEKPPVGKAGPGPVALTAAEEDSLLEADRPEGPAGVVDSSPDNGGVGDVIAPAPPGGEQVATPEPVAAVGRSLTSPTRTIPAGAVPSPSVERSYLDDPEQMTTYWIRTALTVAFVVFLLVVLFWALGRLGDSVGEVLDLFKTAS